MLETGQYATIKEIAKADRINLSYVSRVVRLMLLAPDVVEPRRNRSGMAISATALNDRSVIAHHSIR